MTSYRYHSDNETLDRIHDINLSMLTDFDRICRKYDIPYYLFFGGLLGAIRHKDFIPWDNDVDVCMRTEDYEKLKEILPKELDKNLYEWVLPADFKKRYFDNIPRILYKKCEIQMDPSYTEYYYHYANKICLDIYFLDRIPESFGGKLLTLRLQFIYGLLNGKRHSIDLTTYRGFYKAVAVLLRFFGRFFPADFLRKRVDKLRVRYNSDSTIHTYRITNDQMHTFSLTFPEEAFIKPINVPIHGEMFLGPSHAEEILTLCYGDWKIIPPPEKQIPHWGFIDILPENFIFTE